MVKAGTHGQHEDKHIAILEMVQAEQILFECHEFDKQIFVHIGN